MPYRLVNNPDTTSAASFDHYDGTFNFIPFLRDANSAVSPKASYYFIDFCGPTCYTAPHHKEEWSNFYRISGAQIVAAGGFPGNFRSYLNHLDSLEQGIFQEVANLSKFMKENSVLWHNLTFINPSVTSSAPHIYTSAFEQTGRTILHLVNGNYNNDTQTMSSQTDFTVSISLSSAPANIWMTTPDQPSNNRKRQLPFTYSNGKATFTIPSLEVHDVVVMEQGSSYNPIYAPLEIKFPFPTQQQIPVGNSVKTIAVATDGLDSVFDWYVNDTAGGSASVGTIDSEGVYTAPATVPNPDTVTIKAVSRVDASRSKSYAIQIIPAASLPWSDSFSADAEGSIPSKWNIVNGRGDWQIKLDGGTKVLNNFNISEGFGDADKKEVALYAPFIASGDQAWTNYEYKASVKLLSDPVYYYNVKEGTAAALVFRYQDDQNYYEYTIDAGNKAHLYKVKDGVFSEIGEGVDAGFLKQDSFVTLSVQAYENNFRFWIGSHMVREDKDNEDATLNGGIGIKASFIEAVYKDITASVVEPFTVAGATVFRDPSDDFSKVYKKSDNLVVDTNNPASMGGDAGRFARTTATAEWVSYELKNKYNMKVKTYFWDGEAISHFRFFVSTDHMNWNEIQPNIHVDNPAEPGYWYTVTYTQNNLPSNAKYLKIQWGDAASTPWTPQIGETVIQKNNTETPTDGHTVIDDMSDFSKIFGTSDHIGIDTSNSDTVGSNSRFVRTVSPSSREWVTYAVDGQNHAQITAAYWDGEPINHFKFYTSIDYDSWTEVIPTITTQLSNQPNYWHHVVYDLNGLPSDTNYLKIEWDNLGGQPWNPQLQQVILDTAEDPDDSYTASISPSGHYDLRELTERYVSGSQEVETVTITKTGTGDLKNIRIELGGKDADRFVVTQPVATTLNAAVPSTTFTIAAKDGLQAGTYTATVTVMADRMDPITLGISQVVKETPVQVWLGGGGTPAAPKISTSTAGNWFTASVTVSTTIDPATGAYTAKLGKDVVQALVAKVLTAEASGQKTIIEVQADSASDAKAVMVEIPADALKQISSSTKAAIRLTAELGTILFDTASVHHMSETVSAADTIRLEIRKIDSSLPVPEWPGNISGRPVYRISVHAGNAEITRFGDGSAEVSVKYSPKPGEHPDAIVVYAIDSNGKPKIIKEKYDPATGTISFRSALLSPYFAVGYNEVIFDDVASNAWYADAVRFIAAREVTLGTAAGQFEPNRKLTRGELMVMLMKAYGMEPDLDLADNFDDAGKTYYTGYLAAAKRLGIAKGTGGNQFSPDSEISREDLIVLLYRMLKVTGELPGGSTGRELASFSDADQVSSYGQEAFAYFVKSGTISGDGVMLNPQGRATRAQMVQILYLLLRNSEVE